MKFHMALAALLAAQPVFARTPFEESPLSIPVTDARDRTLQLAGKLCLPEGHSGKLRFVLINHGTPPDPAVRPTMKLGNCASEPAQWFLGRGFAVIYMLRRGYGATGGDFEEGAGGCDHSDYVHSGLESARDVEATVNYAAALPWLRSDGNVVAGVSAGGWATLAYGSVAHPHVAALVDFAGGRGGHHRMLPNSNCKPDKLADAAGVFGKTATTPMIWVYAENDTYFSPQIASNLYRQFTDHGGKADFHAMPAFADDGHTLWGGRGGSQVWSRLVETYLRQQGVLGEDGKAAP